MPFFGLPYDDEERRRRLAEQALSTGAFPRGALTPPINPNDPPARPLTPVPYDPRSAPPLVPPTSLPYPGAPVNTLPPGPMPSMNEIRSPLPSLPVTPRPTPPSYPGPPGGAVMPTMPTARQSRPEELAERRHVYQAGTPGRGKSAWLNALKGAALGLAGGGGLGGALGGAAAGGLFGAIDPGMARRAQFEREEKPRLMEDWRIEDADRQRQVQGQLQDAQLANIPREAAMDEARLRQIGVQNQVALENAQGQRALRESQVKLNEARAEAARTGKPQRVDRVNPETERIETVMVYPNGDEWIVGGSAAAAISAARNQSAERRGAAQQSAATGRTGMTQAGANQRQTERLAAQGEAAAGASKLRPPSGKGGVEKWQGKRAEAKAALMASGMSDTKAEQELNRIGIR